MYATSRPYKYRTIQDNLRLYIFAQKHNLTIEQVEIALELDDTKRKEYLKELKAT